MDIEALKAALGDEKFAALKTYVDDLTGQRDTARNESITGRKKLKDDLAAAQALASKALEKLGVDGADDLDALPDAKGQGEALKQFDAKVKRLERERDELKTRSEAAEGKHRASLQRAAVADALGRHEFIARDVVETFVAQRLAWEGDDILFRTDDGKLVPVADGVAGVAKTRPELLKAQGTGGAGARVNGAGGAGGKKQMTRADFERLEPASRMEHVKAGGQVIDA